MKEQNSVLNLWKFIASCMIMGHHGSVFWKDGNYPLHGGYIYTEFFFMISGFFLVSFLERKESLADGLNYCKRRLMKIFPYTTIAFLFHYILISIQSGSVVECLKIIWKFPLEVAFLTNLHITASRMGQLWYVAAMLFVMPILVFLYNKDKLLFKNILTWAVPVLWYGYLFTTYKRLGNRGVFLDLIRAFANLLLGGGVYYISVRCKESLMTNWKKKILMFAEWAGILFTVLLTVKYYGKEYDFLIIFIFVFCLSGLLSDNNYENNIFMNYLGSLSMVMYVVHVTVRVAVKMLMPGAGLLEIYIAYYMGTIIYSILLMEIVKGLKQKTNITNQL